MNQTIKVDIYNPVTHEGIGDRLHVVTGLSFIEGMVTIQTIEGPLQQKVDSFKVFLQLIIK